MNSTAKQILEIIRGSHLATGVDVSRYNQSVDFDTAEYAHVLEVVDYCMVRGSTGVADGTVYIDPLLNHYYAELQQHPHVVRDVYHYLSSHSPWTKQYDTFMQAIDGKQFEILTLDGEKIYNVRSKEFAHAAHSFMLQLINDFPTKRVKFYSNRYDYQDWFNYFYNFDQFDYHHAQYPWARWDNVEPWRLPHLYQSLTEMFTGVSKPNLPSSRAADGYVMWQVGAYTGIGEELGFGADYLDVNVSRLPLQEFLQWSGIYKRWQPGESEGNDMVEYYVECTGNLNIREGAGKSYKETGLFAYAGNSYQVYEISPNNWYRIEGGWISGNTQYTKLFMFEDEPTPEPGYTLEEKVEILWDAHPELH